MSRESHEAPSQADIRLDFRQAVMASLETAILACDKSYAEFLQKRFGSGVFHRRSKLQQAARYIRERLVPLLRGLQRSDYLDCQRAQRDGDAVCVDGIGFRLLVRGHRLFLDAGGKQAAFDLDASQGAVGRDPQGGIT